MKNVICVEHPLSEHSLTILRDRSTLTADFKQRTQIVTNILFAEATRSLAVKEKTVSTPLTDMTGHIIKDNIILVPVLRAGLAMLFAAQQFVPWATAGFIGLERDEETAIAREYYQKFPEHLSKKKTIILDPMLATGGSLLSTISALYDKGASDIEIICIVAAPEGCELIANHYPDIKIYTAALDSHLNDQKIHCARTGRFRRPVFWYRLNHERLQSPDRGGGRSNSSSLLIHYGRS
ncbi:MAG: uracil phosphoribosyltransferase [candidate division KSB1 bacterium]|nr:uracil phosphoribosyltransferase [candidate division KSB1 bacterium]